MYGSLEKYQDAVSKSADECIEKGFLLAKDRAACIKYCIQEAEKFGLE